MAGKKKKTEVFDMDDGIAPEAGGLNDAPEFDETSDDEIEFVDHVELDDEPEEPEIEVEEDPEPDTKEPEPEPDPEPEDEVAEEPEPEPEIDPAERRFNEMVAMIAKKDEQVQTLVDQVRVLTEKVTQPAVEKEEPAEPRTAPTPPDPDEMEWNEYVDAKLQYAEEMKAYEAGVKMDEETRLKAEQEAKQSEAMSGIQAIHTKDFADEAEDIPALKENETVRAKWAEIYYDPKNAFNTRVDGVFRATRMLKALARKDGIDLVNFGKKPAPESKPAIDPEKLKADEAARSKRVATGAMQDGSKSATSGKIKISSEHREAAEKFGVSPEAYMQTLKALGGK